MKYRTLTALGLSGLGLCASVQPALAQVAPADDTTITVVATGLARPLDQTGQSISVVGIDEIETVQGPDLTRVLTRLPGVSVNRSGGLGAQTSVFVRGANSEHLLVMIDGVRVEDVSAPSGGYDFGGLVTGGVGKVELLRGSNSVAWGSAAIGGVIAITSRELNGAEGTLEYGSLNTWSQDLSAGISRDAGAITLNAGHTYTRGIPVAIGDTQPDGFEQWHVSARSRLRLADGLNLVATARYADSHLGIDGFPPPNYELAYTGEFQTGKQASGRVGLDYTLGALTVTTGVAQSELRRAYVDPTTSATPYYTSMGSSTRADMAGHLALPAQFALDFGADSEWTRFRDTYDATATARLTSGHALIGWYDRGVELAGGVRVDDHSAFGTHWTFGANGSARLIGDLRLRASYGEGFKAPTLYQLLSDYGSAALKPETSTSYDVALEKGERNGLLHGAVTWFHRDTTNLIDFVSCAGVGLCATRPYGVYANVSRARAQGLEIEGDVRPVPTLQLHAAYTYVESTNQTAGSANFAHDLARRPRHMLSSSVDWTTPVAGLTVGGDIRLVSASFDDAANTVQLAGYALVGVNARLPICDKAELFGRIENLTKERYTMIAGYGTQGRTASIGLRAKL